MGKPKHRRCATCAVVTSRYARTERNGPFALKVWARDAGNGEQQDRGTGRFYCDVHAVQTPPAPVASESVTDALLRRAADDPELDDDTFAVLSRALRSVDPVNGEAGL
jgi:hypothetical protein